MGSQIGQDSPADAALVARIVAGDDDALADLYDRHAGPVYSLACAITMNAADAEEAVADTFLQAWRQAARFDGRRGSVAAWLMTMARTRALDLVRARARHGRMRREAEKMAGGSIRGMAAADDAGAADALHARRLAGRLLAELPAEQRHAIELAYLQGMSHSEIASALDAPLGTVKTRIRAGMQKLRDAVRPLITEAG